MGDGHCIRQSLPPASIVSTPDNASRGCTSTRPGIDLIGRVCVSVCVLYKVAVQSHKSHGLGGRKELVSAMHYGREAVMSVVEGFLHVSAVTVYSMGGTLMATCL